ncbi:MAG: hypothetical protein II951_08000 [Bacteroidales bacterium]|nr:hypothetical protein [Bacteroidales bacterium]
MEKISNNQHSEETPLTTLGKTFELVDLGLSVKWATFNLGATKPEEAGDYFMWGDKIPATGRDCFWSTYKYANGTENRLFKYVPESLFHKFNLESEESYYGDDGFFDNKTVLEPDDDAAYFALGGKFRMPTPAEWRELHDNCTWLWAQFNGVNGYLVISNKDGFTDKSIFLPAAGLRSGSYLRDQNTHGAYWSASLVNTFPTHASCCYFYDTYRNWGYSLLSRYLGLSVRPVSD